MNASLAEYLVATHAGVPEIDVTMIDRPDFVASPLLGAKGCGEIGNVGITAAIANAVHNATGVRVRDLPILRVLHAVTPNSVCNNEAPT